MGNGKRLQAVLAGLLIVVCGGLWFKRLGYSWWTPPAPVAPARPPAPAAPPSEVEPEPGAEAPVLATIAWRDPHDPVAIPLGYSYALHLLDTRDGLQLWDVAHKQFQPLPAPWTGARLLDGQWMLSEGRSGHTMFAVASGQPAGASILLMDTLNQPRLVATVDLPRGFIPQRMLRLRANMALFCAPGQPAFVVADRGDKLEVLTRETEQDLQVGGDARLGVSGPVHGFGDVAPRAEGRSTLHFNLRDCRWTARDLPAEMAGASDLQLEPRYAPGLDPSILAASWSDPASGAQRTLAAPLQWSYQDQRWLARKPAPLPGIAPARLGGVQKLDLAFAAAPREGRLAFLEPHGGQWRESLHRMPAASGLKLLPSGHDGVLALLVDEAQPGRVVRLRPAPEVDTRSPLRDMETFVVAGESMLALPAGGGAAALLAPGEARSIEQPAIPVEHEAASGVALRDGSVLVFGGRQRNCRYNANACVPQPAARWLPALKRWQQVPELTLPFVEGRQDFTLDAAGALYFMNGRLQRWSEGGKVAELARPRRLRSGGSLVALQDGRLAYAGGKEGGSEVYDPAQDRWLPGPQPAYEGGRVLRLGDGSLFKLGQAPYGDDSEQAAGAMVAEVADPGFNVWVRAPAFPLPRGTEVKQVVAFGRKVLLLLEQPSDRYVLWDGARHAWQVLPLPRNSQWSLEHQPRHIAATASGRLLLVYDYHFEYLDLR